MLRLDCSIERMSRCENQTSQETERENTMRYRMLMVGLSAVTLIGFAASNAIADESKEDHVVIIKCAESNQTGAVPRVAVHQASSGFELPDACSFDAPCADCLAALIQKPFPDCEGGDEFTSNVQIVQQSNPAVSGSVNIEKYVFACGGAHGPQ